MAFTTPDNITCGEQVFDACFHPNSNALAVGLIDGSIEVHNVGFDENDSKKLMTLKLHKKSCRGVAFSDDGYNLYSISSDKSIRVVDQGGKVSSKYLKAHDSPINKLLLIDSNVFVSGDDSGSIKIWDIRKPTLVRSYNMHEDFISGLSYLPENNTLLSVGGDAFLCAYDLRVEKNVIRSDDQESEIHCMSIVKWNKKVICGTQEGVVLIFSWGRWGDCSDRYPGNIQSVNCMLKMDESTVILGSDDGLLRVVSIQPNRELGILGSHDSFPVEGLIQNKNTALIASFSHDETVRFWDSTSLREMIVEGEQGGDFCENEKRDDEGDMVVDHAENMKEDTMLVENNGINDTDSDGEEINSQSQSERGGKGRKKNHARLPNRNERFFSDL